MSRIGKAPIPIPDKVSVSLNGLDVTVKGPKGELSRTLPDGVDIAQDGNARWSLPAAPAAVLGNATACAAPSSPTWSRV